MDSLPEVTMAQDFAHRLERFYALTSDAPASKLHRNGDVMRDENGRDASGGERTDTNGTGGGGFNGATPQNGIYITSPRFISSLAFNHFFLNDCFL